MDNETNTEEPLRQRNRKLEHDLRERNRELGCLYGFANVVDSSENTLEEALRAIVRLLPQAFQYPEIACGRIVMGGQEFRTDAFRQTPLKLASPITVRGNDTGTVEIFYTEERPDCDEGPFLAEERSLIDMIAGRLGRLVEQKTTEDAIRRSEEKYRSIFENAVEGIFQTTPKGFLLSANPAYARMFGYSSPEELIGGSFNVGEHVYANVADRVRFKEQIEKRGLIQTFQFEARKKDGTRMWACLNARAVKGETGKVLYYEGTIEDITLLKQAEQEARDNAERYRRLFDLESDAIFLIDNETGGILEANNAALSLYGFSKEEILEKRNEDLSAEPEETRRATQSELGVVPVRYHRKKNGTVFPVEITATHLMWNGRRSHLAAIRDITERKRIEDALLRNEEEYRNIYDNAMVGIFQSTPEGRYLRVNNALASIHGFSSPEDMIGGVTRIGEQIYVNPQDRQRYMDLLRENDTIRGFEAQLYRKDGNTVWISMNVKAVRNPDGPVAWYEGIVEDITERRKLESQLRQAQKMESLGTLAGGIAHDFNNILTSLMGYATLIQIKMDGADPLRQYVGQMLSASEKAADLVKGLLAFSRQQSVRLAPLGMNDAIKETQKLLKRLLTENIELHTSLTEDETTVMADRSQIDQILFNLATNARDAMPRGGAFTIGTEITVMDNEFIRVHGFGKPGKYVAISVSDTGIGMDRATLGKIFDPFFTTKETGKGTGLGLATVYGIVQQHNGYIGVYSEPGYGTVFRIYIPAVSASVDEREHETVSISRGSETILIAEDNTGVRRFMLDALGYYGYRIIEATDGEDAVDKFRLHRDVDLVILDSVMPKKNGREVYDEIRGMRPDVKVVFISGYTKDVILDKGVEDRKIHFIAKPLSINELLRKIREVLEE